VRTLAGRSIAVALRETPALRAGVLLRDGRVTHEGIAAEAGLPYTSVTESQTP
jgi:hypothetical protein